MWTNEEIGASCLCKAKRNALCFNVFIRFGQEKGSWLGCCGEGCWDGWGQPWQPRQDFPNITWVLLIHSSNEDTGQKSSVLSTLSSCSLFCLKSNCFIASQGVLVQAQNGGQMLSILTFSLANTRLAGWGKPLWYEHWQAIIQHICGEQLALEIEKKTSWRKTSRHVLFYWNWKPTGTQLTLWISRENFATSSDGCF